MRISGFSMCRNAELLYYPVKQSIESALPLVDEFVIAVGKGEASDQTLQVLGSIDSSKLKIIETEWDLEAFRQGTVHAQQTDLAKQECTGDWLLYLQADEVLHEKDLSIIQQRCEQVHHDLRIEGLLLNYLHFWGDYHHLVDTHGWYQEEIRLIRNRPDIHSWQSAQSFRAISDFDGVSYRKKEGSRKLRVARVDASIYHYGWVRPPSIMAAKVRELDRIHSHQQQAYPERFDYGDLSKLTPFKGSHPEVMKDWIEKLDWQDELRFTAQSFSRKAYKHERFKNRMLTLIERGLFGSRQVAAYKNYDLIE